MGYVLRSERTAPRLCDRNDHGCISQFLYRGKIAL